MAFKVLSMMHAPDADKEKHRSVIVTGKLNLFIVVVKNQRDALETVKEFVEKEKIDAITLCSGFTSFEVAEIAQTVGPNIGVSVARHDGPSYRAIVAALKREGFMPA